MFLTVPNDKNFVFSFLVRTFGGEEGGVVFAFSTGFSSSLSLSELEFFFSGSFFSTVDATVRRPGDNLLGEVFLYGDNLLGDSLLGELFVIIGFIVVGARNPAEPSSTSSTGFFSIISPFSFFILEPYFFL